MTKEKWCEHIESMENLLRPSLGGQVEPWKNAIKRHKEIKCQDCFDRKRTKQANERAKARHEALTSIGLVRVRGALGGIYYE